MLTSLAFVFLAGLAAAALCQFLHIPRILGMLAIGIVLGPYALNLLDPSILSISADLREMALIIILLKAGLSLDLSDLKRVGRPAVLMAFVPASCEILACILFAPRSARPFADRSGGAGRGARGRLARDRGPQNGAADGERLRDEKKRAPAHSGRGIV